MDIVFAVLALILLMAGYPVALTLGGFAVLFAFVAQDMLLAGLTSTAGLADDIAIF